jgi:putative redox protein
MEINARGVTTIIDDLIEDGGPGDGFRPTELLVGALGACTIGTMLTFAKNTGMPVEGVSMVLEAEKAPAPSRVSSITMVMEVAGDLTAKDLERLQRVAKACTVHNTLKNEPLVEFKVVAAA